MLAASATLTFLIAMWLCATIVASTLELSRSKIIAALKGRSLLGSPAIPAVELRLSQRYPATPRRSARVQVALRAAA